MISRIPVLVIAICFLSVASVRARNLIIDSSFELGLDRATTGNVFRWEEGDAFHGKHFARLVTRGGFFRTRRVEDLPATYTFSAYLRSPQPGVRVYLRMGVDRWNSPRKAVTLTPEWQRYHMTVVLAPSPPDPERGRGNIYGCWIDKDPEGMIDLDAVQWEEGELTPYTPALGVCVAVRPDAYAGIFVGDEPVRFTIGLANNTARAEQVTYEVTTTDVYDRLVLRTHESLPLESGGLVERDFDLPTDRKGYFAVKVRACDRTGRLLDSHVFHMARVARRFDGKRHPKSFFGVHPQPAGEDLVIRKKRWRIFAESGARWCRSFAVWRNVELKQGEFRWDNYFRDSTIREADEHAMNVLVCFAGLLARRVPKWALDEAETAKAGFEIPRQEFLLTFLREAVARYGDCVDVWETVNEPYLAVDSGRFAEHTVQRYLDESLDLHRQAGGIVRSLAPGVPVIANVSGFGQMERDPVYLKGMLARGLLEHVDGISFHFYRGKFPVERGDRVENAVAKARKLIAEHGARMPTFYQTESSTCSNDLFDDTDNLYGEYRQMMMPTAFGYTSEIEAARNWVRAAIIEVASGMRVTFWFVMGYYTNYKVYGMHTMIKDHWRSPKIIYPAYNALTCMIDEAEPLRELKRNPKWRAYAFKRGREIVIPVWHLMVGKGLGTLAVDRDLPVYRIVDFMGNQVKIEKEGGRALLPLDEAPHYLVCPADALTDVEAGLLAGELRDFQGKAKVTLTVASGEGKPVLLAKIRNNGSEPISGRMRLRPPAWLRLGETAARFGPVPGMESGAVPFPIAGFGEASDGTVEGIVQVGDRMPEFSRDVAFLRAPRAAGDITLDGEAGDWAGTEPILSLGSAERILAVDRKALWRGATDCSAELRARWTPETLYLIINVHDDVLVQDRERPFQGDCVEIFLDCRTAEDAEELGSNDDDLQICFVPPSGDAPGFVMVCGDEYKKDRLKTVRYAARQTKDGYTMEIAFPVACLMTDRLRPGSVLGFNWAVDDRDEPGERKRRKCSMVWFGHDMMMWKFTDRLGFLVCEEGGDNR
jgi:hypothetical protein